MLLQLPPTVSVPPPPFELALGVQLSLVEPRDVLDTGGHGSLFLQVHRRISLDPDLRQLQRLFLRIGRQGGPTFRQTHDLVASVEVEMQGSQFNYIASLWGRMLEEMRGRF